MKLRTDVMWGVGRRVLCGALLGTLSISAMAAEHQIHMLNYGDQGGMVFEPGYLQVAPGDTVTFVPDNTGHSVKSQWLPEGVEPWQSTLNQPFSVTLDQEGVYLYFCPPHLMMNMTGVIQVGQSAGQQAEVKKAAEGLSRRAFQNKGRLADYMQQIDWAE